MQIEALLTAAEVGSIALAPWLLLYFKGFRVWGLGFGVQGFRGLGV